MEFIGENLQQYIGQHCSDESDLLKQLNRETQAKILRPRMLSGHVQGRALSMFSKMIQPTNILEIGTYTGYSALCLLEGLSEKGELHTIDINEELEDFTNSYFQKHPKGKQIKFHIGDAATIITKLKLQFQLVFIDADKESYQNYYEMLVPLLPTGAYIISDNVLWSGKVLDPIKKGDSETKAIIDFNKYVQNDDRVENLLLGIRDGLLIARIK